ncbi:MAG: carboxypeptidase regulatory-like domain-containing protein [Sphingomonas sp.]
MRNKLFIGVAAAALLTPVAAYAQETTSTIRGVVTGDGAPVGGATVTILHVPTNATQTVVTGSDGSFVANGLRVGGPYTVTVSAPGFEDTQVTDITTSLGAPFNLPLAMNSSGDTIVVTASKVRGAGLVTTAATTTLGAEEISQVATVNRDIRDLARRSPLVDVDYGNNRALTFAGKNPRFNLYTIDGVQVNDSYGLNSDGMPTKRGPVPLEAIEQFSAMVAPYDISYGLFQGGVVNSVLKSGTNKFHGNLFFTYTDDGLTGSKIRHDKVDLKFTNKDWGGEIDGPIIKDRLFFMIAGERVTQGTPFADGPADGGYASVIPNLTSDEVSTVQSVANSVYGYDTGPIVTSEPQTSEFVTGKLDFVISDRQHLSLTWINAYDVTPSSYDTSTSSSSPQLGLRSHYYSSAERLHAGIARLNSQWTDNFSTEIRGIYKNYRQPATPLQGLGFGMFTVCVDPTGTTLPGGGAQTPSKIDPTQCSSGSPRINFGPDQYRHANLVDNDIVGGYFAANLNAGSHNFKLTTEAYDHYVYNLFVPQSLGVWYFDDLADYQNKTAGTFTYTNATTGNPQDAAVKYHYQSYAFGLQDNWHVTPDLNVLLAARYDLWGGHDRPAGNPDFFAREGYYNTKTYDGLGVFQPRMSVDWNPTDRLHVSGGFGKFAAGNPDIYLANSFGNTGVLSRSLTVKADGKGGYTLNGNKATTPADIAIAQAALNNVNGQVPAAVASYVQGLPVGSATINALDPNFKIPSEWRGTLSADYKANLGPLGDGWDFGADFFYTKTIHGIGFYDARSVPTGLTTPDGRTRYWSSDGTSTTLQDIILTNFDKGRSYVAVARFDKSWDWGLSVGASYTYEDVKDNAAATSSQATSLYKYTAFDDPNLSAYGTSNDQIKWQAKFHADFDHAFFGDYKTKIALFGSVQAGRPFSYTMQEVASGRSPSFGTVGNTSGYLLYVPTGVNDPNVVYDNDSTKSQLDEYIDHSVLKKYRGKVAPRNIDHSKTRVRMDLHLEQEIPTFVGGSRIALFADVENFLNLLNSKWGVQEQVPFSYTVPIVKVQCLTAGGAVSTAATPCAQYKYSANSSTGISKPNQSLISPIQNSLYLIRVGVRLKF